MNFNIDAGKLLNFDFDADSRTLMNFNIDAGKLDLCELNI